MRVLISAIALWLTLTACGGSDEPSAAPATPVASTSSTAPDETPAAPEGESPDCLVAATKWADRMSRHAIDAVMSVELTVEPLDLSDTEDPTSEAKALCSNAIVNPLTQANYEAALLNADLFICGSVCTGPDKRKASAQVDRLRAMVDKVKARL